MKGFILAAGYGERLKPLTDKLPKSLIPVLNLPSICYAIYLLKEAGIKDVVCNLHYKDNEIVHFFEEHDFFGLNVSFSTEEKILGTGGGIKNCEKILGNDEFVLINSDIILDIDLKRFIDFHKKSQAPATLLLYRTTRARKIGAIGVDGGNVIDFNNLLDTAIFSEFIYSGVAVLSPIIFRYLKKEYSSVVNSGYVGLIENHSIDYFEHEGFWQDIGSIRSYWEANVSMMKKILSLRERISKVLGLSPQIISPSCIIGGGSIIKDSVVGGHCTIGDGVFLDKTMIFPNSTIVNHSIIKSSLVYENRVIEIK